MAFSRFQKNYPREDHLVWFYSRSKSPRELSSPASPLRPVRLFSIDRSAELLYLINSDSILNSSYLKSQRSRWGIRGRLSVIHRFSVMRKKGLKLYVLN